VVYEHVFTRPVRDTDSYDVHFRAPAVLHKAGVTVLFSTGVEDASLVKNLPYHAAQAVAHGFPAEAAVRALTVEAARWCGLGEQLGSIEPGREATLFAATGDVLDIRTQVVRMWVEGREVGLENRHTRLYEKYRQRPGPRR
jgi:imidazolonepropionase-like amidohydrolase